LASMDLYSNKGWVLWQDVISKDAVMSSITRFLIKIRLKFLQMQEVKSLNYCWHN